MCCPLSLFSCKCRSSSSESAPTSKSRRTQISPAVARKAFESITKLPTYRVQERTITRSMQTTSTPTQTASTLTQITPASDATTLITRPMQTTSTPTQKSSILTQIIPTSDATSAVIEHNVFYVIKTSENTIAFLNETLVLLDKGLNSATLEKKSISSPHRINETNDFKKHEDSITNSSLFRISIAIDQLGVAKGLARNIIEIAEKILKDASCLDSLNIDDKFINTIDDSIDKIRDIARVLVSTCLYNEYLAKHIPKQSVAESRKIKDIKMRVRNTPNANRSPVHAYTELLMNTLRRQIKVLTTIRLYAEKRMI